MALLTALATPLAVYATTFFAEPLYALALTGFLLLVALAVCAARTVALPAGTREALQRKRGVRRSRNALTASRCSGVS